MKTVLLLLSFAIITLLVYGVLQWDDVRFDPATTHPASLTHPASHPASSLGGMAHTFEFDPAKISPASLK